METGITMMLKATTSERYSNMADQNTTTLPPIDMSTSVPLNQPLPTPASTVLPKIDMSTSVPLDTNTAAAAAPSGVGKFVRDAAAGLGPDSSVPGGPAETAFITGLPKTIWDALPPIELVNSVKQILPLIHTYETARSNGSSMTDALTAVNETAKQHISNISPLPALIQSFRENPTKETVQALTHGVALAAGLFGGATGAAPEAEAAVAPAAEAAETPGLVSRLTNPFRKLLQSPKEAGLAATQEPAATALRTSVGAPAGTPILEGEGPSTVIDDHLAKVGTAKDAAYKQIDDTVGFDLKDAKKQLSDAQYAIKQPGANAPAIQKDIDLLTKKIGDANNTLKAANIDPKVADRLNTSWEASKGVKNDIVKSTSSDGTINVNQLLNRAKNSRFNQRYGDRLAQAFGQGDSAAGKPIADAYIRGLEAAQAAGKTAIRIQNFKLWTAGLIGAAAIGEAGRAGITALLAP